MLCCINYSRKILPSAIRIDHSLDTIRTIKTEARNYVVVFAMVEEACTLYML